MVTAYVLIEVRTNRSGPVVEYLNKHPEIKEAAAVYGEADVVARIKAASQDDLDRMVMDVIQGNPDVQSTRTLMVIEKFHWER
jgi:DNA-binding Lrp family transcriptional regulator